MPVPVPPFFFARPSVAALLVDLELDHRHRTRVPLGALKGVFAPPPRVSFLVGDDLLESDFLACVPCALPTPKPQQQTLPQPQPQQPLPQKQKQKQPTTTTTTTTTTTHRNLQQQQAQGQQPQLGRNVAVEGRKVKAPTSRTAQLRKRQQQQQQPPPGASSASPMVVVIDDDDDDDDFEFVAAPAPPRAFAPAPARTQLPSQDLFDVFRRPSRRRERPSDATAGNNQRPLKTLRVVLPNGANAATTSASALKSDDPNMNMRLTKHQRKAEIAAARAGANSVPSNHIAARNKRAWISITIPKDRENASIWTCSVAPYDRTRRSRAMALANSAAAAKADSLLLSQAAAGANAPTAPGNIIGPRARLPDRPLVVASIVEACASAREMSGARTMDSMAGPSQMMRASQVIMSSQLVGSQAAAAGLVSDERLALRAFRRTFDAILLHPSWELAAAGDPARLLQELRLLTICPRGFVVAFVSKCSIGTVFSEMPRLGYAYVENLTWCLLTGDAKLAALDSRMGRRQQDALCAVCGKNHPIRCSHFTAVLFRREHKATKKLELKHQRNADVIFAHVRHSHHGAPSTVVSAPCVGDIVHPSLEIPEDVYHALNTLLPSAKGRFLELYANPWQSPPTARSNGWTRVSEHGGTETAEEPEWRW